MLLAYDLFNHYKWETPKVFHMIWFISWSQREPIVSIPFGAIPLVIPWGFHHLKVGGFNMFQSFKMEKESGKLGLATGELVLTISIANGYRSQPIIIANGRGSAVQCHHTHFWKKNAYNPSISSTTNNVFRRWGAVCRLLGLCRCHGGVRSIVYAPGKKRKKLRIGQGNHAKLRVYVDCYGFIWIYMDVRGVRC